MKKIGLLACLFGALLTSACKKKTAEPDALLAPSSAASGSACANPLALAGVTAKSHLAWQQDPDAAKLVSTVNYGNHSVLALSTQFNGDNLVYHVVSVNHPDANTDLHTAPDGTQCAYVVKGQSNTGYVEISTLCAGEVYQILLQTCNRNGDCSAEQALPAPYLQDRNRDAGVQSALAGVKQSRAQVEATATQAYKTIIAYLHAHKGDSNPSPERKQFLSMAQKVEDMGLDLYKVVMYTHYQDTLATVQANFHLADSTSAASAPTGTDGCTPISQIVGGPDRQPSTPITSNAVGDTSGAGSTPAATVTVNHTVSVVVTETETETVTGSTSLTSGQKAEIAVGSVFLFAGALLTVKLILTQNNLRKAAIANEKNPVEFSEVKTAELELRAAQTEAAKAELELKAAESEWSGMDTKAAERQVAERKVADAETKVQAAETTVNGAHEKVREAQQRLVEKARGLEVKQLGQVEAEVKPVETAKPANQTGRKPGIYEKIGVEAKSERAGGWVGIAIAGLLVVGAILTAVGASGSGLADTGSTAEADLLTALSPLALQQSSNLLQYQGSFEPVAAAVQAATAAGKK